MITLTDEEKQKRREYYYTHKDHLKNKMKQYYESNKLQFRKYKETNSEQIKSYRRNYYQQNKERTADYDLQKRYGITQKQYNEMLFRQNGVCAGCGNPPSKRKLDVDHNHTTGKVRSLLCHGCNKSQGQLKENIKTFCSLMETLMIDNGIPETDMDELKGLIKRLELRKQYETLRI